MTRLTMAIAIAFAVLIAPVGIQASYAVDAHHPEKSEKKTTKKKLKRKAPEKTTQGSAGAGMQMGMTGSGTQMSMMKNCPMMKKGKTGQGGVMSCPMMSGTGAGMQPDGMSPLMQVRHAWMHTWHAMFHKSNGMMHGSMQGAK